MYVCPFPQKANEAATKNIEDYEKKRKDKLDKLTIDREENKPFYKQVSRDLINQIKVLFSISRSLYLLLGIFNFHFFLFSLEHQESSEASWILSPALHRS